MVAICQHEQSLGGVTMKFSNGVAAAVSVAIISGSGGVSAQDTSVQASGL
jgi:hypothetical protein